MANTKRLSLPLIDQGQAMKHITHNEALAQLDALVQLSALGIMSAPPTSPPEDACYIVGASPTGLFAGNEKALAIFQNAGFTFLRPRVGWRCFMQDTKVLLVFDGTAWMDMVGTRFERLQRLGVNAVADDVNKLAVGSNNALFAALTAAQGGSGDIRVKLSKEQSAATASVLYQSAWSGRAEMGLMGDDQFRFKVSPQGTDWKEAMVVDPSTAKVELQAGLTTSRVHFNQNWDTTTLGADGPLSVRFYRARGLASGVRSALQANDVIGQVAAYTYDGAQFVPSASITFESEVNATAGSIASRVGFSTASAGNGTMRERCRIDSAGSFRPAFDNSGQLGGSNSRWTNIYLASGAIVTSDMREKTDIASVTRGLEFLRKLKPILYKWKIAENCAEGESDICSRPGKRQHFGFLAQDVKSVLDEQALDVGLYIYDSEADRHGLRYEEFIAPIVCAIQELDVKFEDLSRRLSTIGH